MYNLPPCSLIQFRIFTSLENEFVKLIDLNEGVEFSVRTSVEKDWIPLLYLYPNISGNVRNRIRGYDTFMKQEIQQETTSIHLEVCDITLTDITVQFRWLQFARLVPNLHELNDFWALDDINIALLSENNESKCIVSDSFQNVTKR